MAKVHLAYFWVQDDRGPWYGGEKRLLLDTPYSPDFVSRIKAEISPGWARRWNPELRLWTVLEGYESTVKEILRQVFVEGRSPVYFCRECCEGKPCEVWKPVEEKAIRLGYGFLWSKLRDEDRVLWDAAVRQVREAWSRRHNDEDPFHAKAETPPAETLQEKADRLKEEARKAEQEVNARASAASWDGRRDPGLQRLLDKAARLRAEAFRAQEEADKDAQERAEQVRKAQERLRQARANYDAGPSRRTGSAGPLNLPGAVRLLGLSSAGASVEELKRVWRAKSLETHPDAGGSHGAALQVREAMELILRAQGRLGPRDLWSGRI